MQALQRQRFWVGLVVPLLAPRSADALLSRTREVLQDVAKRCTRTGRELNGARLSLTADQLFPIQLTPASGKGNRCFGNGLGSYCARDCAWNMGFRGRISGGFDTATGCTLHSAFYSLPARRKRARAFLLEASAVIEVQLPQVQLLQIPAGQWPIWGMFSSYLVQYSIDCLHPRSHRWCV